MNEQVEKYILSMIPANIPAKQTKDIYDEFACHLYDRIDFFMEIGYDEQASIDKAIEEFGSSEEVTGQIAKQFEELYHERTWVAVLVGIGALVINILSLVSGAYISCVEPNQYFETPQMFCGFIIMFIMLITTIISYKKGYMKTLLCFGGTNVAIGFSMFWSLYPQASIYIIIKNILYLIDRYTKYITIDSFENIDQFCVAGAVIFPILFGFLNVYLAYRISEKGTPKSRGYRAVILFTVMFFIAAVGSLPLNKIADTYFNEYNNWFYMYISGVDNYNSDIIADFDNTTSMKDANEILKKKGYINADEYEATLDKNTAKKFRRDMNRSCNAFDEKYTVYFKPEEKHNSDLDSDDYTNDVQPFVFLLEGKDGKIKSKGVGSGSMIPTKYGFDVYNEDSRYDPVKLCAEDFKSLKLGESKSDIQKRIKDTYGKIYTTFITYTDSGINEYYRIYCSYYGNYTYSDLDVYFEICFENDILTSAAMYSYYLEEFGYPETESAVYIK